MPFNDDHPLNPPGPDPDWRKPADRNQYESLSEVRKGMREISTLLRGLRRMTVTLGDGKILDILGRRAGAKSVAAPWDLIPGATAGTYTLANPIVITGRSDIEARLTITNLPFTPVVDSRAVLQISNLLGTTGTISIQTTWASHPSAYTFTAGPDYDFSLAYLPLWEFYATDDADKTRVRLADGLYGEKLVESKALRLIFPLFLVPTTTHYRTVPDLI